jgi:A/G-specific adenine glycosylase
MKQKQKSTSAAWHIVMKRFAHARRHRGLLPNTISLFQEMIHYYYKHHGRDLPWRRTDNPYHVLVSEIMLQQTQVDRVLSKYSLFIRKFPDFPVLARTPLREILTVWQGLGYNRRALALKKTAQLVVKQFDGRLPAHIDDLLHLPGVGKATASAVLAFAFNQPVTLLETNIRTVFLYFFFKRRQNVADAEILPLVEKTLDRSNPRTWYHALMDFGVMLKKRYQNPGRKSAHYTKQAPFKGSDRQIRGKILRVLTQKARVSELQLIADMTASPQRVRRILRQLEKERLIHKEDSRYSIA